MSSSNHKRRKHDEYVGSASRRDDGASPLRSSSTFYPRSPPRYRSSYSPAPPSHSRAPSSSSSSLTGPAAGVPPAMTTGSAGAGGSDSGRGSSLYHARSPGPSSYYTRDRDRERDRDRDRDGRISGYSNSRGYSGNRYESRRDERDRDRYRDNEAPRPSGGRYSNGYISKDEEWATRAGASAEYRTARPEEYDRYVARPFQQPPDYSRFDNRNRNRSPPLPPPPPPVQLPAHPQRYLPPPQVSHGGFFEQHNRRDLRPANEPSAKRLKAAFPDGRLGDYTDQYYGSSRYAEDEQHNGSNIFRRPQRQEYPSQTVQYNGPVDYYASPSGDFRGQDRYPFRDNDGYFEDYHPPPPESTPLPPPREPNYFPDPQQHGYMLPPVNQHRYDYHQQQHSQYDNGISVRKSRFDMEPYPRQQIPPQNSQEHNQGPPPIEVQSQHMEQAPLQTPTAPKMFKKTFFRIPNRNDGSRLSSSRIGGIGRALARSMPKSPTSKSKEEEEQEPPMEDESAGRLNELHEAEVPPPPPPAPPVEATAAPGDQVQTSIYERKSQVGEGTYGKVYKAVNTITKELVALKRIRMESERDGFPITASREIKLLQSVRHENVVALLEMMVEKSSVYVVYEYMEHDLSGILTHPSFTLEHRHIKHLFKQILEGLAYLHKRGVLHRDIKGSNILISNSGQLKLADFGLARFYKHESTLDYTNRVITLWYRPPELLFGATVYGAAVDVWGAGCLMVEMYTRRAIFQGQDELQQLEAIYELMGTPTKENWPEVEKLPWYELVKPAKERPSRFEELYGSVLSPHGLELAMALLALDPAKRPSAAAALESRYFTEEDPTPERPTQLGELGEWHEYESKLRRRKEKGKQQQHQP
ncbi:kinase-like domain-containing protein [Limtongia smithiae]|uniref:kinase-like domain-containing protein n=1 Tax=Limtongia smithiae TaxID=1125753 RepID=UPI0034CD5242